MATSRNQTHKHTSRIRPLLLSFVTTALLIIGCIAIAGQGRPAKPEASASDKIDAKDKAACMECHADAQDRFGPVNLKALADSPHRDMTCQDCHTAINASPHTDEMLKEKPSCGNCHSDEQDAYGLSSHSHSDKFKGDHPTCTTCHSAGDPHGVRPIKRVTRAQTAVLCSSCHADKVRMARYNVDTDAVASYNESFHGKAVLKFGNLNAAVCFDCHGIHDVLPPENPKAHTNRANAAGLCSKPACHPGANVTFAMSGANHLRLMVKRGPALHAIDLFFRVLTGGMILFLTGGVALDLRKKVFSKTPPKSGRVSALLTSLSFLGMVAALSFAAFNQILSATYLFFGSIGVLMLSYLIYFATRPKRAQAGDDLPQYVRFDRTHRLQHIVLMVCFVMLIATGLPLRFAQVDLLHRPWVYIGGLQGARLIHRIGALTLIIVWLWHVLDLLYRWKKQGFRLNALTMLPNLKDVRDFVQTTMAYVGLSHEEPKFDRFQFRQKMDYLAEYWGVPIMVLSGFVLWFPIYWGNRLPEEAVAVALVAHGWEATLAFAAIIMWHLYNEHFNPDNFPMSKVWITGTLSREDMQREHPIELARLDGPEL